MLPSAPMAPHFSANEIHKKSVAIVFVIYCGVLAACFYIGTTWLENALNILTLQVQSLKDEIHNNNNNPS